MKHSFDIDLAKRFGVPEAILIDNFRFWIAKNKANRKHFHEGRYWTYNSTKAMAELFPYWSQPQINRILKRLEDAGVLLSGNFNSNPYDRTKWYSLSDEVHLTNSQNGNDESAKSTNRESVKSTNETDIKPDVTTDDCFADAKKQPKEGAPVEKKAARKTALPADFQPNDTAIHLAQELRISIATELVNFADHHSAKGSVMADWQAAFRGWIRKAALYAQQRAQQAISPTQPRNTNKYAGAAAAIYGDLFND